MLYKQPDVVYRAKDTDGYYFYDEELGHYAGMPASEACRIKELVRQHTSRTETFAGWPPGEIEDALIPLTFAQKAAIICEE